MCGGPTYVHVLTCFSDSRIESYLTVKRYSLLGVGSVSLELQAHALNTVQVRYYAKVCVTVVTSPCILQVPPPFDVCVTSLAHNATSSFVFDVLSNWKIYCLTSSEWCY